MLRFGSGLAAALVVAVIGAAAATEAALPPRPPAPSGAELQSLARLPARTSIASQRIYFVMTDRYANGDPTNDRGGLTGPRSVTGYDPADEGWFHGGDFHGLTGTCTDTRNGLARIKDLGFTAVWITPPYGQKPVQGDSAAYHGYWIRDFTGVDPHLGTDQDFGAFAECAHRLGLKVYLDVVVNHTADVIVPAGGFDFVAPAQRPYRDCRNRRFDPARYAAGRTFPCLSASNMPRVPAVPPAEREAKRPAWLNDLTKYHNRGNVNFSSCTEVCFEQGDFFGLDDLFTEQPAVVDGLAEVYADWIRRYRIDGFRVDTARHVNRAFFRVWVPKVLAAARAAGVPDFEIFGEVFIGDAIELSSYVRNRGLPNVLDFPFQDALTRFAAGGAGPGGIVSRLNDDDLFQGPAGVAHTPPTFLGNHDMGRAALKVKERAAAGVGGDELLRRVLLGHSLLYLLRGAPVEYYGDEVGIIGRGGDKQARQDLFPTQVREWQTEDRVGSPPIGGGSAFDLADHPIASHLRTLGRLRDAHPALSIGATIVRHSQGSVLAVSRIDMSARREYVAAFNAGRADARISVRTATPSSGWTGVLGGAASTRSEATGTLALTIPPLTAILLRADGSVPAALPGRPAVKVARDPLSDLLRASATVTGGPVSVAIAVRRAGGKAWQRLAADDSPPYRALFDPARYRRNERLHLVAVARALDGRTAVSAVVPYTNRRR
ncbi:MAG: hypothetical protein H0U03_10090 [Actinobacteria bacterium]|nr:hypothetical protein [Actinomycetota bacterium]